MPGNDDKKRRRESEEPEEDGDDLTEEDSPQKVQKGKKSSGKSEKLSFERDSLTDDCRNHHDQKDVESAIHQLEGLLSEITAHDDLDFDTHDNEDTDEDDSTPSRGQPSGGAGAAGSDEPSGPLPTEASPLKGVDEIKSTIESAVATEVKSVCKRLGTNLSGLEAPPDRPVAPKNKPGKRASKQKKADYERRSDEHKAKDKEWMMGYLRQVLGALKDVQKKLRTSTWGDPPSPQPPSETVLKNYPSKMKIISAFNNKGGVAKTTSAACLAYELAKEGYKVMLVDLDWQTNLTQLLVNDDGIERIEAESTEQRPTHLGDALKPVWEELPMRIQPVRLTRLFEFEPSQRDTDRRGGKGKKGQLYLLPGHESVDRMEGPLYSAYKSYGNENKQALGALNYILQGTECWYGGFDVAILDLSPATRDLNQNSVMLSDYFYTPCAPDLFSLKAIDRLSIVLEEWARNAKSNRNNEMNQHGKKFVYQLPTRSPKFLGTIVLRFSHKLAQPSMIVRKFISDLAVQAEKCLISRLRLIQNVEPGPLGGWGPDGAPDLTLTDAQYGLVQPYQAINGANLKYCLALINEFNRAAPLSHHFRRPVNGLGEEFMVTVDPETRQLQAIRGKGLTSLRKQVSLLKDIIQKMTENVIMLTGLDPAASV